MQCENNNQEDIFLGCNMGSKVKKKEIGKYFWECGANSKENYRATNNEPNYQEESPTL